MAGCCNINNPLLLIVKVPLSKNNFKKRLISEGELGRLNLSNIYHKNMKLHPINIFHQSTKLKMYSQICRCEHIC